MTTYRQTMRQAQKNPRLDRGLSGFSFYFKLEIKRCAASLRLDRRGRAWGVRLRAEHNHGPTRFR